MNRYTLTIGVTLLVLVIGLPLYASLEPGRLADAQEALQRTYVTEATELYGAYCAVCHGPAGEGDDSMPALDNPALRTADYDSLFQTIAYGRANTLMAGWHQESGGPLNDYQIDALLALIRYASWADIRADIAARDALPPVAPSANLDATLVKTLTALGAEGERWADGLQTYAGRCTVCHGVDGAGSDLGVPLNTPELRAMGAVELFGIIAGGVEGTLMTGWEGTLDAERIDNVVAFLQHWDRIAAQGIALPTPAPILVDAANPADMAALGQRLYATTCAGCHGQEGSGGIGPVLNSQQVLTANDDTALTNTIINGGNRPNSQMPAFGSRLSALEVDALVTYLRAWAPDAPWVENPRGTAQGGGPAWLRNDSTEEGATAGAGNGGPWWTTDGSTPPGASGAGGTGGSGPGAANGAASAGDTQLATAAALYAGIATAVDGNMLTLSLANGARVEAMLGPSWFWSESGILLQVGDQIELEGFPSADHLEVNWITNLTRATSLVLRENGQPLWRAGGR